MPSWKKVLISGSDAANVAVTPYGIIGSNNVQGALEELCNEKLPLTGGTLTGTLNISGALNIHNGNVLTKEGYGYVINSYGSVFKDNYLLLYTKGQITSDIKGNLSFSPDAGVTTNLYISSSGNVGIGTTIPSAKLHISGAASESLLIVSSSAGPALFVSGSGNVGIGTTSPSEKLGVSGNIQIGYSGTPAQSYQLKLYNNNTTGYVFNVGDHLVTSGFWGVRLRSRTTDSLTAGNGAAAIGSIFAQFAPTTYPTNGLTVEGNVGIRTTSPSASLEVSGTIKFSQYSGSATSIAGWSSTNFATTASLGHGLQLVTGELSVKSQLTASLLGTASYAVTALSSSYSAKSATSSYAETAGSTISSSYASTSSYSTTALTSSYSDKAISSSYAVTASYALLSSTASYYGGSLVSASYAVTASYTETSSYIYTNDNMLWPYNTAYGGRIPNSGSFGMKIQHMNDEAAIDIFRLVVFRSTTSKMLQSDADNTATVPAIGITTQYIAADVTGSILINGIIRNDAWNWTPGQPLYTSTSSGLMQQSAPDGTGDTIQVVGVALTSSSIWFKPEFVLTVVR